MSKASIVPQRWRADASAARHAQAIIGILETPPLEPRGDGVAILATVGCADMLSFLVAVKSFQRHLQRGRVVVVDDGTLTAQDRSILAFHCGDPELVRTDGIRSGSFPRTPGWTALLTMLERRSREYWIELDCRSVTLGAVPEIDRAVSANRSFASPHRAPDAATQRGKAGNDLLARFEARLATTRPERGLNYLRPGIGVTGFSAGGHGPAFAAALLETMKGFNTSELARPELRRLATGFVLANDVQAMVLPEQRYGEGSDGGLDLNFPAVLAFPQSAPADSTRHAELSLLAIAGLSATLA